ncbi:glycosyltransferase family 4 protein [Aureibaculum luteum]|uniref:glycosyltransferase family 4 protein n=1 Tax=Aureibaculum luteum TaxID=1548456 RepID=UPI000E4A92B7|nr:glycosyltransferase family 4 protein [Aureibaculum luteum]
MKVALLTGGFPTKENPMRGIFNKNAAIEISKYVDLTVIFYRIFIPGRKRYEVLEENGYKLIKITIPLLPFINKYTTCINKNLIPLFLKPYLKDYDVVHSISGITVVALDKLKKNYKFKHIAQFIGADINYTFPELKKMGCVKTLNGIDQIVCNSVALKNEVKNVFGRDKNVSVIYRGVDLDRFGTVSKKLNNDVVFLFLGGLMPNKDSSFGKNLKGGITLMKAWQLVDQRINEETSVSLIYGGPNTTKNEDLNNWIHTLNFKNKVEIIGRVNPIDILKVYERTNVTIIPSQTEGFPNVGMESFAVGNCIIGSNVGGLPELIDDNVNGLIFNSNNEEHLAEQILTLLDVIIVEKFCKKAKEKVMLKYDNKQFGKEYLRIYQM